LRVERETGVEGLGFRVLFEGRASGVGFRVHQERGLSGLGLRVSTVHQLDDRKSDPEQIPKPRPFEPCSSVASGCSVSPMAHPEQRLKDNVSAYQQNTRLVTKTQNRHEDDDQDDHHQHHDIVMLMLVTKIQMLAILMVMAMAMMIMTVTKAMAMKMGPTMLNSYCE